jgi:hypothetical protein
MRDWKFEGVVDIERVDGGTRGTWDRYHILALSRPELSMLYHLDPMTFDHLLAVIRPGLVVSEADAEKLAVVLADPECLLEGHVDEYHQVMSITLLKLLFLHARFGFPTLARISLVHEMLRREGHLEKLLARVETHPHVGAPVEAGASSSRHPAVDELCRIFAEMSLLELPVVRRLALGSLERWAAHWRHASRLTERSERPDSLQGDLGGR